MDLREFRVVVRIVDRVAKRALFAEEQMVALEGQCAEWKRIADELKAERNAAKQEAVSARQDAVTRAEADRKIIEGLRADLAKEREEHQEDVGHLNGEIVRFHGIADDLRNRLNSLGIKAAKQAGEALGMVEGEGLLCAAKRVVKERDAQSALVAKQRHLLAAKQTEIGALEAERDEMKEEIKQANKEASDATARQRMTEARALNYSLQADEARREIERLRAKLASRTVEWPEWAKVGARVRVRSNDCMTTQNSDRVVGEELVIANVDRRDWTIQTESFGWVHVSDIEPVAEHTQPAVAVQS